MLLRAQIGSRPPRCERKCSSCGHCEAIQVPTNGHQVQSRTSTSKSSYSSMVSNHVAYARGDDYYSNYKPISWKCKCGDFIFNPWFTLSRDIMFSSIYEFQSLNSYVVNELTLSTPLYNSTIACIV